MGRKKKQHKNEGTNKSICSINFDACVLDALKKRSDEQGTTVSNMVNNLCRRHILTDRLFYSEMAKQSYLKMQEAIFLRDQAENIEVILRENP